MKERISGGLDKETAGLKQHTIYIDRYGMWYDSGDIVRAQRAERGKSQTSQTSERMISISTITLVSECPYTGITWLL
jgi:hypothetical protein